MHSLDQEHNLFIAINGDNVGKIFCLPDGTEVSDTKLDDIKFNLTPNYTKEMLNKLQTDKIVGRSLEGMEFVVGVVGLNNLKKTEFINCVIQTLARVIPLRNKCLSAVE